MIQTIGPSFRGVSLKPVEVDDAAFILQLRADPDLNRHLSATPPDLDNQKQWIAKYKTRETEGTEYYFIILRDGEDAGTVRLYDFQGDSFCWGSWIIKRGTPPHVAIASAIMVYDFAFGPLGFTRSHFDVRRDNLSVRKFHLRTGAEIISSDEQNDYFVITAARFMEGRPQLARIAGGQ